MSNKGLGAIVAAGVVGVVAWAFTKQAPAQARVQRVSLPQQPTTRDTRAGLFGGIFDAVLSVAEGGFLDGVGTIPTNGTPPILPANRNTAPASTRGGDVGQRLMSDLQRDFGLTREQAAGVVGNLDHETGGFRFMQEINPVVPGSRGGFGFAQWTGPRRREFEAYAADRGVDPTSYEANYGFLTYELTDTWERRVLPALRNTRTVEDATTVFQDLFLRPGVPHTDSRISRAGVYV